MKPEISKTTVDRSDLLERDIALTFAARIIAPKKTIPPTAY